jgi:hypothetical protein
MTSATAHPDDPSSTPRAWKPGARRHDSGHPSHPPARITTRTGAPPPDHATFTAGKRSRLNSGLYFRVRSGQACLAVRNRVMRLPARQLRQKHLPIVRL